MTLRRFVFIFLQDLAICEAPYLTDTALCLSLKNNLVKFLIPVKIRETPLGQDISLKVRNLLHDRLHFPSRLFTPVPLRFEISLLESLFTPAFQAYKKRPRKQPPKQPHRALLNFCVCSGHGCHIYFVTCPGYPNKTYPLLKLPIIPAPVTSGISAVFCHYSDYKKRFCRQKQSHHHTPVDDKYSFHAAAGLYIRLNSPPSRSKTNDMIPIHNRFDYTTPHHKMHISIPHNRMTFHNQYIHVF